MALLTDLLNFIDARKRIAASNLSDPGAALEQIAGQIADASREQLNNSADAQSVMPGVASAGRDALIQSALNAGGMGTIAKAKAPLDLAKLDPLPEMSRRYPQTSVPVEGYDVKKAAKGDYPYYAAKNLSDEAKEVAVRKQGAQKQIDTGSPDYQPLFDVTQRQNIAPGTYPETGGNTLDEAIPKTFTTYDKWVDKYDTPEVRSRLNAAFDAGSEHPLAKNWYAMKQLHDRFVAELGPEAGNAAFKERFADAMAATTGGADPTDNLLTAAYTNFTRNSGGSFPRNRDASVASYDLPFPIGGRYVGGNIEMADKTLGHGKTGLTAESEPKRYNFSGNFLGRTGNATIDEQMMSLFDPSGKLKAPEGDSYGVLEEILRQEAEKRGVDPMNFQDVAWLGAKRGKEIAKGGVAKSQGMPMMEHINQMIHRTSQVTGVPQEEVLRGFIRGNMPMYSMGGAAIGAGTLADIMSRGGQANDVQ